MGDRSLMTSVIAPLTGFLILGLPAAAVRADADTTREFHLQLQSGPVTGASAKRGLSASTPARAAHLLNDRRSNAVPGAERSRQVSTQHIVVVGLDTAGNEVWRRVQLDPRLLRAEGVLDVDPAAKTRTFLRKDVQFVVAAPDEPSVRFLRILKPRWTGAGYALDTLAELPLGSGE